MGLLWTNLVGYNLEYLQQMVLQNWRPPARERDQTAFLLMVNQKLLSYELTDVSLGQQKMLWPGLQLCKEVDYNIGIYWWRGK